MYLGHRPRLQRRQHTARRGVLRHGHGVPAPREAHPGLHRARGDGARRARCGSGGRAAHCHRRERVTIRVVHLCSLEIEINKKSFAVVSCLVCNTQAEIDMLNSHLEHHGNGQWVCQQALRGGQRAAVAVQAQQRRAVAARAVVHGRVDAQVAIRRGYWARGYL